ncbi:MAG: hypothetical protein FJW14_06025 [Acidimicrobiia bacterium]|nr:hypothetical protein [Acidimicrobiia bacterium]
MQRLLVLIAVVGIASVTALAQGGGGNAQPKPVCTTEYNPVEILRCGREAAKSFNPPRTADGKPDFSGYWGGSQVPHENLEAHPRTPDDNGGPSAIVDPPDGKVPIQAWAEEKRAENRKLYIDQNAQCFMSGVPRHLYMGAYQFIQTPTRLVMLSEEANAFRIVYLDDLPRLGPTLTLWQGDSRGRWEGNTLVVTTTNQNGNAWLDQQGRFITDAATVTERFTMFEANGILYEITIDDPLVYTRPFTMALGLRKNTQPGREIWEESCYEGESNTQYLRKLGYRTYPGFTAAQAKAAKEAYERRQGR